MIPIRDTIRSRTTPFVTIGLIAVNAFFFLQELRFGPELDRLVEVFGFIPARFVSWTELGRAPLAPSVFIPWFVQIPALFYLGFWFLMQLLNGTMELSARAGMAGGVAWWAHAGGFVAGIVLSIPFRNRSPRARTAAWLAR